MIPSGTDVLLSFCRYSIISEVCNPTLTAAYSEYAVSLYSWTWFGLHTGSAIATKKSWAYLYTGEKASKKMCPSGAWRGTRRVKQQENNHITAAKRKINTSYHPERAWGVIILQLHLRAVVFGSVLVTFRLRLVHLLPCSSGHGLLGLITHRLFFIVFVFVVPFLGLPLCRATDTWMSWTALSKTDEMF